MKRWWVRLIAAYLVAGLFGTFVYAVEDEGIVSSARYAARQPFQSALLVVLWPITLLSAIEPPGAFREWALVLPAYLLSFVISFWLLARAFARPIPRGLCPTCGYDLRATPDRCPECGAAISNQIAGENSLATQSKKGTKS